MKSIAFWVAVAVAGVITVALIWYVARGGCSGTVGP